MSCGRTKMLPNQTTRTVANWDQNKLDFCGELSPSITITIMKISVSVSVRHWHQYHGKQSWTPGNERWDQVTGDNSVYLWSIRTCYECQRHRKRHTKSLHEIIEIDSMWYLNISRACAGHCLVILKCSCRKIKIKKRIQL